jgi:hypothetical protein
MRAPSSMNPTLTTLYTELRTMAFQDPMMRAVAEGRLSWADACDDSEMAFHDYTTNGEGAEILEAVQAYMNKRAARKTATFATEQTPVQPFQVQQITTNVLFNPNQIKTLIVRNLPRDVTEDELRAIFEKHGPVHDIYIPKNLDSTSPYYGSIKGFALIKFLSHQDSTRAYLSETTRLLIRGKTIGIEFANKDR